MGVDHTIRVVPDVLLDRLMHEPRLWWDDWEPNWPGHEFKPVFDSIRGWDRLRWLLGEHEATRAVAVALFEPGEGVIGEVDEHEWAKGVRSERVGELAREAVPTLEQLCRTKFSLEAMAKAGLYHAQSLDTDAQVEAERRFLQQLLGDLRQALERALDEGRGILISHG